MRWSHAAERQLLELVEDAAPGPVHFYVAPDRRNYLWSARPAGDRSSEALVDITYAEARYYITKLHSGGLLEASFMGNKDITHVSLPLAGHDRLAHLRAQTMAARGRRALPGGLKTLALSVMLPVMTSVITVYVMRALTQ